MILPPPTLSARWNVRTLKLNLLLESFRISTSHLDMEVLESQEFRELVQTIKASCNSSMKRVKFTRTKRIPNHWWNPEISQLRKSANKARRIMMRVRFKYPEIYPVRRQAYCEARRRLNRSIG